MTDRCDQTDGHLLDGRVRYAQPRHGFRSGIEPVLLAAAIPARPGARVLEGGSGAGAALLCLAARVPGVRGLGIEQDPALVALARRNAAANGWPDLRFMAADIASLPALERVRPRLRQSALSQRRRHTIAGRVAPRPQSAQPPGCWRVWATALARPLRPRGTLTFILPAALLPEAMTAFAAAGCAPTAMLPLWAKPRQPAKLLLLRGIKGSRAPFRVLPGLVLHAPDGAFTAEADAILRGGAALDL